MHDEDISDDLRGLCMGQTIADKYVTESVIGSGSMGVIVAARHKQLGQRVAIKLLTRSAAADSTSSVRFLREAQHAAQLKSDHVVRVHDIGTLPSGDPFIVMELLEGQDLASRSSERGPLPLADVANYVAQAADAVAEAHRAGIVHRDLKPANLFLTVRSDGTACVKVLDFGISKATVAPIDGTLTATRNVMGSPLYMSPEQVRDARLVDARSDIWSLGVILYELLSGQPVFKARTLTGICAAIAADDPEPLSQARPDLPLEMVSVVHRCLAKDPDLRFQTADDLKQALEPFRSYPAGATVRGSDAFRAPLPIRTSLPVALEAPTLHSASSTLLSGPRARRSLVVLLGLLGGVLVLGTALVLFLERSPARVPASAPPPVPSTEAAFAEGSTGANFQLSFDSEPRGAMVKEGERELGRTPLELSVARRTAWKEPRTFRVEHPGYRPYSVTQGLSNAPVRIFAALVPEPPTPSTSASVAPAPALPKPGRGTWPPRDGLSNKDAAPPDLDIRTER